VSHDPSEITLICGFAAQETLNINFIINVENSYVIIILKKNQDSLMNRKFKRTAFI